MDLKPSEKPAKNKQTEAQSSTKADQITIESDNATNKTKRTYKADVKNYFFLFNL
jgi:hypothetical protein